MVGFPPPRSAHSHSRSDFASSGSMSGWGSWAHDLADAGRAQRRGPITACIVQWYSPLPTGRTSFVAHRNAPLSLDGRRRFIDGMARSGWRFDSGPQPVPPARGTAHGRASPPANPSPWHMPRLPARHPGSCNYISGAHTSAGRILLQPGAESAVRCGAPPALRRVFEGSAHSAPRRNVVGAKQSVRCIVQ